MNRVTSQLQRVQKLKHDHLTTCLLRPRVISTTVPSALELRQIRATKRDGKLYSSAASTNPTSTISKRAFWTCRGTWKRAGINTFRCLVGCTIGDFSALWALQTYTPDLDMGTIMAVSMTCGLSTSIALETSLLFWGKDKLPLNKAFKTAMGMSFISMLAMELAENAVDFHLTGGVVALQDPRFWGAAVLSVAAGYLVPLPWNYYRLKRWGRACH